MPISSTNVFLIYLFTEDLKNEIEKSSFKVNISALMLNKVLFG